MKSERYVFIIYRTYISHIIFMPGDAAFTFKTFSLSLSDLGTLPDRDALFLSVLQVIAKLRLPIVISSGVSIVSNLMPIVA